MNRSVVRKLILNFVSWSMVGGVWRVGIVCCVISISLIVMVDWFNVNTMRVVMIIVMDIVVDIVVDIMVCIVVDWFMNSLEVSVNVVGWLSNNWVRVNIVMMSVNNWVNCVLFSVLMLSCVLRF